MKNLYFVVLCCLLGFTTSCSDDDNATALLQIDPSTDLVFEAVGGTRTIEVKTDQAHGRWNRIRPGARSLSRMVLISR